MARDNDANWQQVDPTTLPGSAGELYTDYVTKRRAAGAAKAAFEQEMNKLAELPAGLRMVFGYNFGKLSAAVVADDTKPSKPKAPTLSLAAFLQGQVSSGRSV